MEKSINQTNELSTESILHLLRNPWGKSLHLMREARLTAADKIETLQEALEETIITLSHAKVFITSRQKMHPTGIGLYEELIDKLKALKGE